MKLDYFYSVIVSFLIAHKIIGIALLLAIVFFVWKKPGHAFRLIVFLCVMAVILYMINLLGGTMFEGVINKKDASTRTERNI